MPRLSIHLFGVVRVLHADRTDDTPLGHAAQALLAYLVLHRGRLHPREVLGGIFWGDSSDGRARHCLNTAIWRLRRKLEPAGVRRGEYLRTTAAGEIGFNADSDHWVDVAEFEAAAQRILRAAPAALGCENLDALRSALSLQAADLLQAFYDDWALRERERLRLLYLTALERLMIYYTTAGVWDDALSCGCSILALDPLREETHRALMRLYARSGRPALAAQQFRLCEAILARELDLAPMPETKAAYAEIVRPLRLLTTPAPDATVTNATGPLRLALTGLDQVQRELQRALRVLAR